MTGLRVENLRVEIAGAGDRRIVPVDGVDFAVDADQCVALLGESGCGKSMTALALMRLLPEGGRVAAGGVRLQGEDLFALPEAAMGGVRGGRLAMIFQEPQTSLNPVMTVAEQIQEALAAHRGLAGDAGRAESGSLLEAVGLGADKLDAYPFQLSGGQRQRVLIAMMLAGEPEVLIADEPTTALDVTIQAQILDLLRKLRAERGMGLLLITHDLAVVRGMAQQVALMYAGQIVEVASAAEFFAAPKHPYARALLRALPDTAKRGGALAAIGGTVPALWQEFSGCRFAPRCERVMDVCHRTLPEMERCGASSVRCLLYRDGAVPAAPADSAEPLRYAAPPRVEAPAQALLEVRDLSVRFPIRKGLLQRVSGAFTAVGGVSFDIPAGRTLALVGESGCGKTTTGKAIVQLLRQQAVIGGQALFEGRDLFALDGEALRSARRAVQIVFQDPFGSLDPRMRVFDILEEGLIALRPEMDAPARRERLHALVDQVGLRRDALDRYPHEFSGGQRQRIAIARALAVSPRLIVCDEPTSALDVSVQAQILNLLRELQRDTGVSYLFITHNIGVVEYIADQVAVMQRGLIEELGSVEQVLGAPQTDYTRTLLAAVPRIALPSV